MANQDRLYFDGQCPLCSFEMRHLAKEKHDSLELLDIHSLPDLTAEQRVEIADKFRDYLTDDRFTR